MIKIGITVIAIIFFSSCNEKKIDRKKISDFEKSFKEQPDQGFNQHLDSTTNIYSNFKYHVAFDGPDNWKSDMGVSEHTIFRTFLPDSLLTFSINVIEQKIDDEDQKIDIWDSYLKNKALMDDATKTLFEKQLNAKVQDYSCQKSYIKNHTSIKRKFNYDKKDLYYQYNVTLITYQTIINELTYTFSLSIPTRFYNENSVYYDSIFGNISFLKDRDQHDKLLNQVINSSKNTE